MDKYCEDMLEQDGGFCKYTNRKVPRALCCTCRGNYKPFILEDLEFDRWQYRPALTEDQKNNKDLVSVLMPCRDENPDHIRKTIESLRENAVGPIEIIVSHDGKIDGGVGGDFTSYYGDVQGQRRLLNDSIKYARGKYLFRIDGHCLMSPGWDARMKSSCKENTLVIVTFDSLDDDFKPKGKDNTFAILRPSMRQKFIRDWKPLKHRLIEEEAMTISGTAFMVLRDGFSGFDEDLGAYGGIGTELALRYWLTGGRVIIRTDTVCYHLFRRNTPYEVPREEIETVYAKIKEKWIHNTGPDQTRPFQWYLYKFSTYTRWSNAELRV